MKTKTALYLLFLVLTGCTCQEKKNSDNVLLGDKVKVTYLEEFDNTDQPEEWLEGLDKAKLYVPMFEQIYDNNYTVYTTDFMNAPDVDTMKMEQVLHFFNDPEKLGNYDQLEEILFTEEWIVPNSLNKFTKRVNSWCPIRVYERGGGEIIKMMSCWILPNNNSKGNLFAQNIFSEFKFSSGPFPRWTGLDDRKFIDSVFSKIRADELKVIDPIYIVDKSERKFTADDIEEYAGLELTSKRLRGETGSLIFEENWYFHPESMNIYKEVLSVGFVRKYYEEGKHQSKILFFLKF